MASPAPAGWASSSRSGSSRGRRVSMSGTWTHAASAPRTRPAPTPSRARRRSTRPTTTSSTPGTSARPGVRSGSRPPTRGCEELGATFGEKSGWERANWFDPNEALGDERLRPRGWAGRHWSPAIGAEHTACREAAALFDESSFAKIEVAGPGAAELLEWLCDNRVARDVGAITYTQMLNAKGGIECDFTVTRLADERFRIVTGTAFGRHDLAWIRQHAPGDGSVTVEDVTSKYACIGIWGPASREILAPLTTDPLDFSYMRARELDVGPVPCLALRVTYVGELGWELYCPSEFGLRLWDTIWAAGREHGLVAGGYKAIDSLRLEKGYRVWGSDITADDTPGGGRSRLRRQARQGLPRQGGAPGAGRAGAAAGLPDARRPPCGCARLRAGSRRRRARRPRHERRLRLHGRPVDRVRLPPGRKRRAGNARRGGDLRRVGGGRGRGRAALRPEGRAAPGLEPQLAAARRRDDAVADHQLDDGAAARGIERIEQQLHELSPDLAGACDRGGIAARRSSTSCVGCTRSTSATASAAAAPTESSAGGCDWSRTKPCRARTISTTSAPVRCVSAIRSWSFVPGSASTSASSAEPSSATSGFESSCNAPRVRRPSVASAQVSLVS